MASVESWRRDILYLIFIDRFAGYDPAKDPMQADFMGGKIRGVIDNLDYIQNLGATAVYLTPFLKGLGYHGYEVTDFQAIDERFGTLEELRELGRDLKRRGMKLVIDFVPNHLSHQHPFFVDAQTNPASKYRDWFYFTEWPNKYLTFLQFESLPKINLQNPEARDYIIKAAEYWVKHMDVDAMRLDHAIGPTVDFWNEFRTRLKRTKPDIALFAEAWVADFQKTYRFKETLNIPVPWDEMRSVKSPAGLQAMVLNAYGNVFDGYMDFSFNEILNSYLRGELDDRQVRQALTDHYATMPSKPLYITQLDNPDMDRIMHAAHGDVQRVLDAISLQFSLNQPAVIYYGSELGMTHDESVEVDPTRNIKKEIVVRQPMPALAERDTNNPIFRHYQKLIKARRSAS